MLIIILLILLLCAVLLIIDLWRFLRGAMKSTLTFWISCAFLYLGYRRHPEKYFRDVEKELEQ